MTADSPAGRALLAVGGALWRILLYGAIFAALLVLGAWVIPASGAAPLSWQSSALSLTAALLAGWAMMGSVERRPPGALGFFVGRAAARESVLGFGVGAAMLVGAVATVALTGGAAWVPDTGTLAAWGATLAGSLGFFALAAAVEEAVFRGYPFQVLVRGLGAVPATLAASALFAVLHAGNPNVTGFALVNIFIAGVMLSVAYLRTRSLWFATAVHLGWNWTMSSLLDLPVSGLVWDTPLYSAVERGADWWTGGEFGPEAGFAATLALAAGTFWMMRSPRLRPSDEVLRLGPLVDEPPPARDDDESSTRKENHG